MECVRLRMSRNCTLTFSHSLWQVGGAVWVSHPGGGDCADCGHRFPSILGALGVSVVIKPHIQGSGPYPDRAWGSVATVTQQCH